MTVPWDSENHFVGVFWIANRPQKPPEIISIRAPFSRAEPKGDMLTLPPGFSEGMGWDMLRRQGGELSPDASEIVQTSSHKDWPGGRVVYFINSERWHLTLAPTLSGRGDVIVRVQSLFAIDPEHCIVAEDRPFSVSRRKSRSDQEA